MSRSGRESFVSVLKHMFTFTTRRTVAAIAISISHGYTIEVGPAGQDSDPLVKLADNGMRAFSESAAPGKWLVDLLPFCEYCMITRCLTVYSNCDYCSAICPVMAIRTGIQEGSTGVEKASKRCC
jgi:hypothetical protein